MKEISNLVNWTDDCNNLFELFGKIRRNCLSVNALNLTDNLFKVVTSKKD